MVASNKHKFQSFYTNSFGIVDCMTDMLDVHSGDLVLEPCAGEGAFVEALLKRMPELNITLYEIDPNATNTLKTKFGNIPTIKINNSDTLLSPDIILRKHKYTKIIGNPPYGLKFTYDQKSKIRKIYSSIYNKESYILFLYSCLRLLEREGRLCFIIPDTFLTLNRFEAFRKSLLSEYCLKEILLFPSRFFPGISFGYSNLCIVAIEKPLELSQVYDNIICIYQGFDNVEDLQSRNCRIKSNICQRDVVSNPNSAFCFESDVFIRKVLNFGFPTLGDYADCVTGFYSGCDKDYLKSFENTPKSDKYGKIAISDVFCDNLTTEQKKRGIESNNCFVPIVKGGNIRYKKNDTWFMDWSVKAVDEYRKSKKCRFQNEQYYFNGFGIGVPMVRSKYVTAALIGERLFDQSIVGVFPKERQLIYYMLAYLNSRICSDLVNAINPTTNNSANYLKRIPFKYPTKEEISFVDYIVKKIFYKIDNAISYEAEQKELNEFFANHFEKLIKTEHSIYKENDFDLGGLFSFVV